MSALLIYLIKSSLYLTLLYGFFWLAMRKVTFFRLNRWMLLIGTVVCMLLPFHTVSVEETGAIQAPMLSLNEWLVEVPDALPVAEEATAQPLVMDKPVDESGSLDFLHILFTIYLIGVLYCIFYVGHSLKRMWQVIESFPKVWQNGYWLVVVPDRIASFCWNRYVVISEEDFWMHPSVLVHEEAHQRKHHSWDLILFSVVAILHWFNPLVWMVKKELQLIHEYEADNEVLRQGIDASEYQLLLIQKAVGPKLYSMANSFNQHKLKNRITMMHQEKSNSWGRLKWLMVVPVVAGAMFAFAQPEDMGNLASYKVYFQEAVRKQNLSMVETGNVHSFNVSYDNRIFFKNEEIASRKDIKRALAPILEKIRTSSEKEMHCLGVSYEAAANEKALCSYLKEIKEAYEEEDITPLVFISEPSYADAEGVKRYYGIEISFPDKKMPPLRNFTEQELKDAVKQVASASMNDEYVRVGFRATKNQKMENVNEVRRMLKNLYHPQEVIFRQTVWKE